MLDVPTSDHDRRVVVKVIDVKGRTVKLGIQADSAVKVDRAEERDDCDDY